MIGENSHLYHKIAMSLNELRKAAEVALTNLGEFFGGEADDLNYVDRARD